MILEQRRRLVNEIQEEEQYVFLYIFIKNIAFMPLSKERLFCKTE